MGRCVRPCCLAPNSTSTNPMLLRLPLGWRTRVTAHEQFFSSWRCTLVIAAISLCFCRGLLPGRRYSPTSWDSALAEERRCSSVLLLCCCARPKRVAVLGQNARLRRKKVQIAQNNDGFTPYLRRILVRSDWSKTRLLLNHL